MIQEQFINFLLDSKDASILKLNNITSDYFSECINEFNFIKNHLDLYKTIPDKETFANVFPDFNWMQVTEPPKYLLDELIADRKRRFLVTNYKKLGQLILNQKVDDAYDILKELSDFNVKSTTLNCKDYLRDSSRYDSYLDISANKSKYFVRSSFPEVTNVLEGGYNIKDDVVTFVARNGLGKSWILLREATEALRQGKRVGIYSGEMSELSVQFRLDTLIGNIPNGSLMHGSVSVKDKYKNFIDELPQSMPDTACCYILTPEDLGGLATLTALEAFVEKYQLEVLCIDQHSLLEDEKHGKSSAEKAANISLGIKTLQKTLGILVIAVSQQNREASEEKGKFNTTQVAGSDRIPQDSSIVMFIDRDEDILRIHMNKVRNGKSGVILTYKTDLNLGRFTFVPDEKTQKYAGTESEAIMAEYSSDEVVF